MGAWTGIVDLTAAQRWCDGAGPDYKYFRLLPPESHVGASPNCPPGGPSDLTWQRNGRYQPDPDRPGDDNPVTDLPFWITHGFGGTIAPDSCTGCADGAKLPTYINTNPALGGNLGSTVASSFYCSSIGTTATTCNPSINWTGTYFFAKDRPGYQDVCQDRYGSSGVGCRDVGVLMWAQPEVANSVSTGGTAWSTRNGIAPDRLRVARILNFRIYCDHDGGGNCTKPPSSVVGTASNASVWGRFVSPAVSGPCPTCTGAPSLNGNTATLES